MDYVKKKRQDICIRWDFTSAGAADIEEKLRKSEYPDMEIQVNKGSSSYKCDPYLMAAHSDIFASLMESADHVDMFDIRLKKPAANAPRRCDDQEVQTSAQTQQDSQETLTNIHETLKDIPDGKYIAELLEYILKALKPKYISEAQHPENLNVITKNVKNVSKADCDIPDALKDISDTLKGIFEKLTHFPETRHEVPKTLKDSSEALINTSGSQQDVERTLIHMREYLKGISEILLKPESSEIRKVEEQVDKLETDEAVVFNVPHLGDKLVDMQHTEQVLAGVSTTENHDQKLENLQQKEKEPIEGPSVEHQFEDNSKAIQENERTEKPSIEQEQQLVGNSEASQEQELTERPSVEQEQQHAGSCETTDEEERTEVPTVVEEEQKHNVNDLPAEFETANQKKIVRSQINPDVIEFIMKLIDLREAIIPNDLLLEIANVCISLKMNFLVKLCARHATESFSVSNLIAWYKIAVIIQDEELRYRCVLHMSSVLPELLVDPEFTDLSHRGMVSWTEDLLNIEVSLYDLLWMITTWVSFDRDTRLPVLPELFTQMGLSSKHTLINSVHRSLGAENGDGKQRSLRELSDAEVRQLLDIPEQLSSQVMVAIGQRSIDGELIDGCWYSDGTDEFKELCRLPEGTKPNYSICASSKGFVLSGGSNSDMCAIYNVTTGRWRPMPALDKPRHSHGSALLDGAVYVLGGCVAGRLSPSVQYSLLIGTDWKEGPTLPMPIYQPAVTTTENVIFLTFMSKVMMLEADQWSYVQKEAGVMDCVSLITSAPTCLYIAGRESDGTFGFRKSTDVGWPQLDSPKYKHYGGDMVVHDEKLYLLGGDDISCAQKVADIIIKRTEGIAKVCESNEKTKKLTIAEINEIAKIVEDEEKIEKEKAAKIADHAKIGHGHEKSQDETLTKTDGSAKIDDDDDEAKTTDERQGRTGIFDDMNEAEWKNFKKVRNLMVWDVDRFKKIYDNLKKTREQEQEQQQETTGDSQQKKLDADLFQSLLEPAADGLEGTTHNTLPESSEDVRSTTDRSANENEKAEDKVQEKAEDKVQEKREDKVQEKAEDKVQEKREDKVQEKAGDKVQEKTGDNVQEKAEDKVQEKAEDKVQEKAEDKVQEKAEDKVQEKAEDKVQEKAEDKVQEKAEETHKMTTGEGEQKSTEHDAETEEIAHSEIVNGGRLVNIEIKEGVDRKLEKWISLEPTCFKKDNYFYSDEFAFTSRSNGNSVDNLLGARIIKETSLQNDHGDAGIGNTNSIPSDHPVDKQEEDCKELTTDHEAKCAICKNCGTNNDNSDCSLSRDSCNEHIGSCYVNNVSSDNNALNKAQNNGNSTQSNGNSTQSNGNSAQSNGNRTQSNGNSAQSNGNSTQSNGNSTQSNGNSVQSNANCAQSNGNSTKSNANGAQSNGNSAQSNANFAQSDANSAQRDANSAQSDANGAHSDANGAHGDANSAPKKENGEMASISADTMTMTEQQDAIQEKENGRNDNKDLDNAQNRLDNHAMDKETQTGKDKGIEMEGKYKRKQPDPPGRYVEVFDLIEERWSLCAANLPCEITNVNAISLDLSSAREQKLRENVYIGNISVGNAPKNTGHIKEKNLDARESFFDATEKTAIYTTEKTFIDVIDEVTV